MLSGFTHPLYLLPFDHRHSYESTVFHYHEPLNPGQIAEIAASKAVIYDAFKAALDAGVPRDRAALLVDEEFGAAILEDAHKRSYITAMPLEKSGQDEFDFQNADYPAHLNRFDPTFAKVLVRYNPEGDAAINRRQEGRLRELSQFLATTRRKFMFELLVPAEAHQLATVGGIQERYDQEIRPALMVRAIHNLQDAGIEPDVWKVEGLDRRADCHSLVAAVQHDGRGQVGIIVLGRGENERKVLEWIATAAAVPGFIGFAVGRSSFLQSSVDLHAGKIDRPQAVKQIAAKFIEWVKAFEAARAKG